MISRVEITPNMDMQAMATAINDNFRQIEAENRTKIIKDEDGVARIMIGRTPKGEYLIAVSAKGKDVLEAIGQ